MYVITYITTILSILQFSICYLYLHINTDSSLAALIQNDNIYCCVQRFAISKHFFLYCHAEMRQQRSICLVFDVLYHHCFMLPLITELILLASGAIMT